MGIGDYIGNRREWLLQTGKFALYNKARELQREWESEELSSRDQEAATGIG
jgi:hypothetical protein